MNQLNTRIIIFTSLAIAINFVGGQLAVVLRLPIYLDTIGTFFAALAFGPIAGLLTGLCTGLVNGLVFDPISLYFIPVQLVLGFLVGLLSMKGWFKTPFQLIFSILLITLASSIIGSVIATFVFNGITSSGSSYIVQMLKASGISVFKAVFGTQIITGFIDKSISIILSLACLKCIPTMYFVRKNESIN